MCSIKQRNRSNFVQRAGPETVERRLLETGRRRNALRAKGTTHIRELNGNVVERSWCAVVHVEVFSSPAKHSSCKQCSAIGRNH